jgi:hypothetical protein
MDLPSFFDRFWDHPAAIYLVCRKIAIAVTVIVVVFPYIGQPEPLFSPAGISFRLLATPCCLDQTMSASPFHNQ